MNSPHGSPIRQLLRAALLQAMRQRDKEAVSAYRTTLSAIDNAEALPLGDHDRAGAIELSARGPGATEAPRRSLSEADVVHIVNQEAVDLRAAAASLERHNPDAAGRLSRQAVLLQALLDGDDDPIIRSERPTTP